MISEFIEQYKFEDFISELRSYTFLEVPVLDVIATVSMGMYISEVLPSRYKKQFSWLLLPVAISINVMIRDKKREFEYFIKRNPMLMITFIFSLVCSMDFKI